MNIQINDIIDLLHNKYKLPRTIIARIVRSQFKLASNIIRLKGSKTINYMYLGKFKPTPYRLKQLKEQTKNNE